MYKRSLHLPIEIGDSFFLFGPRGTGKTSWLKSHFKKAIYLDLLKAEVYTELKANPSRLEGLIPEDFTDWVILDEVQKIPELLNEVHWLIESKKIRFILTGSSARSLRRKGVNLLAGRALVFWMYPLTAEELGTDFSLAHSLQYGHLPATFTKPSPSQYLKSYVSQYLREEVLQEGLTRNLGAFTRFLEIASFSQGSILNMSQVAREALIGRKTVEGYFGILEDLLLAMRLPAFTKRAKRRITTHPKFYLFDVGVYRSIRPTGLMDRPEEIAGIALESLVLQEIRAISDYHELGYRFYYWRTVNGQEVDFILYGEKGLIAIEVKRSTSPARKDLSALLAFKEDYPMAKLYCFYGGKMQRQERGISLIPFDRAFKELPRLLSEF